MHDPLMNPILAHLPDATGDERAMLDRLIDAPILTLAARRDLLRDGERPRMCHLILEGWACRYKTLEDGRRQITAFVLPGDLCDLHPALLSEMDHSLATITPIRYVEMPRERVDQLLAAPRVARALWRNHLIMMAIQREWTVSIGQRDALERLAHLLCELLLRLRVAGRAEGDRCDFPLTQTDLAEATGMTPVHVNRMVQELRGRGLIHWKGRVLTVLDSASLCRTGLFNPTYLHLSDDPRSPPA